MTGKSLGIVHLHGIRKEKKLRDNVSRLSDSIAITLTLGVFLWLVLSHYTAKCIVKESPNSLSAQLLLLNHSDHTENREEEELH